MFSDLLNDNTLDKSSVELIQYTKKPRYTCKDRNYTIGGLSTTVITNINLKIDKYKVEM